MTPEQALAQIGSMYTNVGLQLWSIFGDLIVVASGLLMCGLMIFGIRKIKLLMALSSLSMEGSTASKNSTDFKYWKIDEPGPVLSNLEMEDSIDDDSDRYKSHDWVSRL